MKGQKALFSHKSDEWATPQSLFDSLNIEFNFNFDPFASRQNHKTKNYYTIKQDGLSVGWNGLRCFVNPPYSKIREWVEKCYYEIRRGTDVIVLLVPARTDTKWFHSYIYICNLMLKYDLLKEGLSLEIAKTPPRFLLWW
jgi:site-specific DNA-methyltransferase (adenine-specific)